MSEVYVQRIYHTGKWLITAIFVNLGSIKGKVIQADAVVDDFGNFCLVSNWQ